MAEYLWAAFLVTVAAILGSVSGYTPSYVYMDDNCLPIGNVIQFSRDIVMEYSSFHSRFPANYRCKVVFQNRDSSRQIQMRFLYLDIVKSNSCSRAGLVILEGTTALTPKNGVCGATTPVTRYRTKGNQASIQLTNNGQPTFGDFEILLTSFYTANNGSCRGDDFACNNGICISNQLTCNGYNDCGDNSDEVEGCNLTTGAIVGIVFGAIFFTFLVVAFGLCLRRRRLTYTRVTEESQDLLVDHLQTLTARYDMLEIEQELLKKKVRRLEKKTDWHENYLRRQNLLFFGIPRTVTETHEQCAAKVRSVIANDMRVKRTPQLQRVRRLAGNAAVVVTFLTARDKMHVLAHAGNLAGKQVRVKEDFSQKVRDVRRGLAELRDTYRGEGKRAVLRFDKLYTEFDVFTYDLATKTVKKVDPVLTSGHACYLHLTRRGGACGGEHKRPGWSEDED